MAKILIQKTEEPIRIDEELIDQELLNFIKTAGSWKAALALAKETPISDKLIPALVKFRKKIADSVKSGSTLKGSSLGADSDIDINIKGDNAGKILIEENKKTA